MNSGWPTIRELTSHTGAGGASTYRQLPTAQVMTPPNPQTGAVDLAVVLSDGGVGFAPESFSYGPTILEVVPNGATAEGGQTGVITPFRLVRAIGWRGLNYGAEPINLKFISEHHEVATVVAQSQMATVVGGGGCGSFAVPSFHPVKPRQGCVCDADL
jgi:hypothetical protein